LAKRSTKDVCSVDKRLDDQPWWNTEDCCLDRTDTIYTASTWVVPILVALTFHEAAHPFAAWKLGERRLTALAASPSIR
jgi:hypothetical protein